MKTYSGDPYTEDHAVFGRGYVYCKPHLAAHTTGWCTVSVRDKIRLDSTNLRDAEAECRVKALPLYNDSVRP